MKLAIIQIRGVINTNKDIKNTLKRLKLPKKNSCVIIDSNNSSLGMLVKLKDFVTWGELDKETIKALLEKRAKLAGKKPLTEEYLKSKTKLTIDEFSTRLFEGKSKIKDVPGLKPFFRLTPPSGGFEKNGVKTPFSLGGALGYRKEKINSLIRRMI